MKRISTLLFLIVNLTLYGQTKNGIEGNKLLVNIETVNKIYIAAYCSPIDSCRGTQYQLHHTMVEDLINRLNKSNLKDSCNFSEEYLLYIHLKDGTIKKFKINRSSIEGSNDRCFNIGDSGYFKNLWLVLDKEWIELNKK